MKDKENKVPMNQNSINNTTDEANPKLVELVANQLAALSNNLKWHDIIMVILSFLIVANMGLTFYSMYQTKRTADTVESESAFVRKYVWELKHALNLQFSEERTNSKQDK